MKKLSLAVLAFCACFFLFGCGKEGELKEVIEENLKACQNEYMTKYLDSIEDGPLKNSTEQVMKVLFEQYDLKYELVDFKVISCKGNTAVVEVKQKTTKVSGPVFRDNIGVYAHTLKKHSSGWKFVKTEIKSVEYL